MESNIEIDYKTVLTNLIENCNIFKLEENKLKISVNTNSVQLEIPNVGIIKEINSDGVNNQTWRNLFNSVFRTLINR